MHRKNLSVKNFVFDASPGGGGKMVFHKSTWLT